MNKQRFTRSALALATLAIITGCDDDDDNQSTSAPAARTITVSYDTQQDPVDTTRSAYRSVSLDDYPDAVFTQEMTDNGYVHILRNDGYTITVTDDNGTNVFTDQLVQDGDSFQVSVVGETTISFSYPDIDNASDVVTTPYYTVSGSTSLTESQTTADIVLTNEYYAFLTLQPTGDASDALINGIVPEVVEGDGTYAYDYITDTSVVTATAVATGETLSYTLEDPEIGRMYSLSYTAPEESVSGDGNVSIDVEWDDEIDIDTGGNAVVAYHQFVAADSLSTNSETGAVSGSTAGAQAWLYEPDTSGSIELGQTSFSFDVDFAGDYFVNVYLTSPSGEDVRADINSAGVVTIEADRFDSYQDFRNSDSYRDYVVRNYIDNYTDNPVTGASVTQVRGNYFLRLGDSTYSGTDMFTINDWALSYFGVSTPDPVIPLDQIAGAAYTQINADGSVSGATTSSYATRIYVPVSGSGVLAGYDFMTDFEFSGDQDFINIYLENPADSSDTLRIDYLSGTGISNTGMYVHRDSNTYYTYDELIATYGTYKVSQFIDSAAPSEGGVITGNFIWRSSDSLNYAEQTFKISDYKVTYTEPSITPVVPLDQVKNADNLEVNADGSVSGDLRDNRAAYAFSYVDEGLTLNDYTWQFDATVNSTAGLSDKSFVNIYLESGTGTRITVNYLIGSGFGTNQGGYEVYDSENGIEGLVYTYDEIMANYSAYTVLQWTEGLDRNINFLWRSGDSSQIGSGSFVISQYSVLDL